MDLADAHIKALNYTTENNCAEVFNLGSGSPVSNRELLDVIQKHTGKMDIKFEPNRAGDPAYLVADITKVKNILNWNHWLLFFSKGTSRSLVFLLQKNTSKKNHNAPTIADYQH